MQKRILLFFALSLILSSLSLAQRQRVGYVDLINRASAPQIFIDNIILPSENGQAELGIIFRFNNDFLPYKKITTESEFNSPDDAEYYTIIRLSNEVFIGRADRRTRNSDQVNVASRDMWIDTLYTRTFDETESNNLYASGSLITQLEPGEYNYVLQLSLIENTNDRNTNGRNFRIPKWDEKPNGEVYLIKSETSAKDDELTLTNVGNNIFFGEDFRSLIRIPNFAEDEEYTLNVYKMNTGRRDTTKGENVYSYTLKEEDFITGKRPELTQGENPGLMLVDSELDLTYILADIPHSAFQNSAYSIELTKASHDKPVAKKFFRSYWQNMPASLLNLDIAISHMKFIVEEEDLKELRRGTSTDKEKKFREFWEKRDPSQGTIYNELMAEYYRRIDFAFKEFSNRGNFEGHESDQGKVYINYGPPDSKDRQFPTNGKVIEVWKYGDKSFVFEASTGFGDFVLVGTE